MVTITDKPEHDPVADLPLVDGYLRWALEAAKKELGESSLNAVLRAAGLERFIGNYPAGDLTVTGEVTFGDYTNFSAAIITLYGAPGRDLVMHIGRASTQYALSFQRTVFNVATVAAARLLPDSTQIKMGLAAVISGFNLVLKRKGGRFAAHIEDRGDYWAFVVETCALCAGKQADGCIGWLYESLLEEAGQQTFGKFFDVVEVECKAMGAPAGVWLVPKTPGDAAQNQSAPYDIRPPADSEAITITDKTEPDPVAGQHVVNAYVRWALLALETVVGPHNLPNLLRAAKLERLIGNYPPDSPELSQDLTFRDYANLNAALLTTFGWGGVSIAQYIGQISARLGRTRQFEVYNVSEIIGSQTLPPDEQLKLGMEFIHMGLKQLMGTGGEVWEGGVEDRGDQLAFTLKTCPLCVGKQANACLGAVFEGLFEESIQWLLERHLDVHEVACLARGDPEGVWEVEKPGNA